MRLVEASVSSGLSFIIALSVVLATHVMDDAAGTFGRHYQPLLVFERALVSSYLLCQCSRGLIDAGLMRAQRPATMTDKGDAVATLRPPAVLSTTFARHGRRRIHWRLASLGR